MPGSWDEWGREPGPLPPRRWEDVLFRGLRLTREILETIVPAIIIALLINLFMAQATRVFGQSMEPNLHTDQRIVVEKVSYRFHLPQRGDIVVLKLPQNTKE